MFNVLGEREREKEREILLGRCTKWRAVVVKLQSFLLQDSKLSTH